MTEPASENARRRRRPGSIVFGIIVGLAVAWWSYHWITDPERGEQRAEQERAVYAARGFLEERIAAGPIEIVDPLAPERSVGKVYVFSAGGSFEVSGYYRRDPADDWHSFLASVGEDGSLIDLKVRDDDAALARRALSDPALTVVD